MEAYDLGEERSEEMVDWKLKESEFNVISVSYNERCSKAVKLVDEMLVPEK